MFRPKTNLILAMSLAGLFLVTSFQNCSQGTFTAGNPSASGSISGNSSNSGSPPKSSSYFTPHGGEGGYNGIPGKTDFVVSRFLANGAKCADGMDIVASIHVKGEPFQPLTATMIRKDCRDLSPEIAIPMTAVQIIPDAGHVIIHGGLLYRSAGDSLLLMACTQPRIEAVNGVFPDCAGTCASVSVTVRMNLDSSRLPYFVYSSVEGSSCSVDASAVSGAQQTVYSGAGPGAKASDQIEFSVPTSGAASVNYSYTFGTGKPETVSGVASRLTCYSP